MITLAHGGVGGVAEVLIVIPTIIFVITYRLVRGPRETPPVPKP